MDAQLFEKNLNYLKDGILPGWPEQLTMDQFYEIASVYASRISIIGWRNYTEYINRLTVKLPDQLVLIEKD